MMDRWCPEWSRSVQRHPASWGWGERTLGVDEDEPFPQRSGSAFPVLAFQLGISLTCSPKWGRTELRGKSKAVVIPSLSQAEPCWELSPVLTYQPHLGSGIEAVVQTDPAQAGLFC